ncbi:MAG: MG2 domain-containing protein [Terracidiphilus sp.]|jgi:hypothetical protein
MNLRRPDRSLRLARILSSILLFAVAALSQEPDRRMAAEYARGSLVVTIPYHSEQAASGKLTVEILDPEDHALGRTEGEIQIAKGDGVWQRTIRPEQPIPFEEIVWQRVRYRFEPSGGGQGVIEGVESISQILRRPVVHILGQKEYLAGSRAAIRVLVSDSQSSQAQAGSLRIDLLIPNREPLALFSGKLDRRGAVEAGFLFPAGLAGKCTLRFVVETSIGTTETTEPVELKEKASILLTTEKPIYQPGQSIHARALALDRASSQAAAGRKLTFVVEDSRGNKVFRKATETDSFGIASAEFALADEVNLGAYHLRALMGDPEAPANTAELTFTVERYVLPKFKVEIEFPQKDGKPRRDYHPGEHVIGTVRANYFFGKPVANAEIAVKAKGMDVAVFEAGASSGATDESGVYRFDLTLPDSFAGRPLSQGAASVLIEATVKDSAAHTESRGEPITVSQSPLLITAVPEGGTLIPNIENEVFILASYPDGSPARTAITVHNPEDIGPIPLIGDQSAHDMHLLSDSAGIAVLRIKPRRGMESLRIAADDHRGNRVSTTVHLQTRGGADQILLRADRAVFKAGEHIQLKVLSTRARGTAYIDFIRNGQTILTRDLDLVNGEAELAVDATPEMAGTLDIDTYLFGSNAQPVADHRLVFVQPADELKIETTADAPVYRPGAEARVHFHVTNARGEGVSAAIGLEAVDEAVFALAEKQPGFAKVFFYLEQELLKPRYEIHSLSMNGIVENADEEEAGAQDRAARALFSAAETVNPHTLDTEAGRALPQANYEEYHQRYQAAFTDQVRQLAAILNKKNLDHLTNEQIVDQFEKLTLEDGSQPRDAWNTPLRVQSAGWRWGQDRVFLVQSAGPDRQFYNSDDLSVYLRVSAGGVVQQPGERGSVGLRIEHDRGPENGHAEVTGTVTDVTGAVIPGATVTLQQLSTAGKRAAYANNAGQFNFAALPAGHYRATIYSPGFVSASSSFSLQPRDRAILSVTLQIGAVTEMVAVQADALQVEAFAPEPWDKAAAIGAGVAGNLIAGAKVRELPLNGENLVELKKGLSGRNDKATGEASSPAAHVRSWFPEALYINPEILTDGRGDASITIPIADSITTWRMAMLASTQSGALGSANSSLKVFQDFFVDLDLPVTLTQGDRVSIPVALYNYSGKPGKVSLKLQPEDWFALEDDSYEKTVPVESGQVGGAQFTLSARRIGKFKLTLSARMDGVRDRDAREDIVVREIEVIPNGREQNIVFNGRLDHRVHHDLAFPAGAIPDATSVLVRLYPGPLSQVIEGMDSILRMPGGCFEQTSSSTYPNVLALDYMKRTGKLTPEIHAKAEGYIANGYQRLLTFEVPGGGFSWFGQAPANKILTAYGLMEFSDMSKVSNVDPRLIERTGAWLAGQQQPDGSWKPDTSFINEGATNRYNSDVLRITAYIAWSLSNTGYQGAVVERAKRFIESHVDYKPDAYTLAVIANFAADYGKDRELTRRSMQALVDARTEKDDQVFWSAEETGVYSTGSSAAVETTGLAAQALLKWGQASETVRKSLSYLSSKKQAAGNWGTTQATIMALRALLLASQLSASDVRGTLEILLDGKPAESLKLTAENNDLLHQFVFKGIDAGKSASIDLAFDGEGTLAYQVVGRYFTPWEEKPEAEPLSIDVAYDRTRLAQYDIATAKVTIRNNLTKTANMVMVDLGIPPGFDLLSEDLQSFQEKTAGQKSGRLEKFSLTATQAILYFNALSPAQTVSMSYRLRAKYPIHARTFQSRVYEYYDPEVNSTARPEQMEVVERQ